jgi:hypothetical protein
VCSEKTEEDHDSKHTPEYPTPFMQEVSKINTVHLLAAGHRHNKINIGDFKQQ